MTTTLTDHVSPRSRRASTAFRPRRFRTDIQGLRAVAVLLVVLYHADVPGLTGGFVGVDVFFVISGYLITQQLSKELDRRGTISIIGFYSRRARRLLPPAALVVVVTLIVARFTLQYSQIASLTKDAFYTAFYGINYHLALEGVNYQSANALPSPLQHYWSLAVEEQFYVVWPLLMIVCATVARRRFRRAGLIVVIGLIVAASLYWSISTTPTDGSMAYFGVQTRAWELGIGALLALSSPAIALIPDAGARVLGWAGMAALLASAFIYSDSTPFPGSAALVPVLGSAAVIAAGTRFVTRSLDTKVLSDSAMQYIGRTSYAWYLWHWPMLIILPVWWGRPLVLWERLEIVSIAFWFAVLTYFIENASARSLWRAGRWVVTGIFLSLVMVAASSIVAVMLPNLQGAGAAAKAFTLNSADKSTVQAAITRSFATQELPSNMTPSLAKAPEDSPWEGSSGCFAKLKDTKLPGCVFGDKHGHRTAVLVGDSHADQWLSSMDVTARKSGWKIIQMAKAACPVAELAVWNMDLKRDYTECGTFQKARSAEITRLQPDLIIASEADAIGVGRYSPTEWASATYSALNKLAGKSTRIVYIGDSPYMTDDGLGCLEKNLTNAAVCIYPRLSSHDKWNAAYSALEETMKSNNVAYVNTRDFFCNSTVCPPVVDNMLTHRDQGHVTNTYARWLAPMFAPIFEDGNA